MLRFPLTLGFDDGQGYYRYIYVLPNVLVVFIAFVVVFVYLARCCRPYLNVCFSCSRLLPCIEIR